MGGYFMLNGKHMFSDFFFNHQPFAAYVSMIVQYLTHPASIFELLLRHRQFLILFGFIFNAALILRFGAKMLVFAIIYELSKFYLFGDRFLAESMIVYPLVYLITLTLYKYSKEKIYNFEYFIAGIFTWFIIFSREPYVPLALFLFFILIYGRKFSREKQISLIVFIILSILTIFSFNVKEYYFNDIYANYQLVVVPEIQTRVFGGPLQILFYPIFILTNGLKNVFGIFLIGIDILFFIFYLKLLVSKKYLLGLIIFIILVLSNLRPTIPGKLFYESYHMLIWYSSFTLITIYMIFLQVKKKTVFTLGLLMLFIFLTLFITSPVYFANEKINQQDELITNYGTTLQEGTVVKLLSSPKDTLFLDGSDDLIYWQAQRLSSYKYTWYTSIMPYFDRYKSARIAMFKNNSPDFYRDYGICFKVEKNISSLPDFAKNSYVRLFTDKKPTCLFINKNKLKSITPSQIKEIATWHYSIGD
jgi:hypothetical protein